MEYSYIEKIYINVFQSKLNRTRADFRKKLKVVYNKAEKANVEVARYYYLFKHAQRRIENKIIYLIKKFNKKMKKWIVCGDISDDKRENLEAKRRNKKFFILFFISKFQ